MKTPLILNLVWTGVAGAAFYAGWAIKSSGDGKDSGTSKIRSAATSTAIPGPGAGSKGVNPLLVSKDKAVLDFFKEFGLDSGTPLTPEKMKEAMLAAIRETDPVKSQMMFARLMEELTAENAPAALAMIRENIGGFESMRYMQMLAYKWGEIDPTTAMKELANSGGPGGRGGMSQGLVLAGWAAKDPKGAMAWLSAYEGDGREKEWMAGSLITGLVRSDPELAMKYAAGLESEDSRRNAAESIAREMIRTGGAQKATEWLNSLTDPDMKRGAFQTVADQVMRGDPAKAAEFVKAYANEDFARGAIGNLARTMASKDVNEGLSFADSLTGKAQSRAIGEVVNEWLRKDRGAEVLDATKYVENLPPGDNRDAGARAIAREVARDDAPTAIAWATSIKDATEREDALIDAGRSYMRQDKAAATAWLAQSGLSAEAQQEVTAGRGDFGGYGGGGFGGGRDFGGGRGNFGGGGTRATGGGGTRATGGGGARGGGGRGR